METNNIDITPIADLWLTRSQVLETLKISDAQYRQDIALLRELKLIEHNPRTKGISLDTYKTLCNFRDLAKQRGKYEAAKALLKQKSA